MGISHEIFPLVEEWGASAVTLHGRSREQRYTRLADWDYIGDAQKTVKRIPVFGNGDVMSFEDHNAAVSKSKVSGIMLARGALIKPWLFTEIKEQGGHLQVRLLPFGRGWEEHETRGCEGDQEQVQSNQAG